MNAALSRRVTILETQQKPATVLIQNVFVSAFFETGSSRRSLTRSVISSRKRILLEFSHVREEKTRIYFEIPKHRVTSIIMRKNYNGYVYEEWWKSVGWRVSKRPFLFPLLLLTLPFLSLLSQWSCAYNAFPSMVADFSFTRESLAVLAP